MSTLSDEVKAAFVTEKKLPSHDHLTIVNAETELAPGFVAMRNYYTEQTLVQIRRSYRHFAGSVMPTTADELITHTTPVVVPRVLTLVSKTFTDGVMIGQSEDLQVKMAKHFGTLDKLFEDARFRHHSDTMAKGFTSDTDVAEFLVEYITQALDTLSHYAGFAHAEGVNPAKIWDVWILVSAAITTSSYMAGHTLGRTWAERDTLDGIAIASTEGGSNDVGGEAGSDS